MDTLSTKTDLELIDSLKAGSEHALAELYDRHAMRLLAVAVNRLNNLDDARDCVQEIFIKLWEVRNRLEITSSVSAYLAVAVKHHVYKTMDKNHRRRHKLATAPLYTANDNAAPSAEYPLLEKEVFLKLEAGIKQLPEKCRLVFELTAFYGKNNQEVSELLDISQKTVQNLYSRASRDIKDHLSISLPAVIWLFSHDLLN